MSEKLTKVRAKMKRWRENPVDFVRENFGVTPDEWQVDALKLLGGGYKGRFRLCLKACTGPGKSALLAWIGWWRLSCFGVPGEHAKGAALSITKDNLSDNLWSELSKWQKLSTFLSSQFVWTKSRIYQIDHPETWFLSARSFAKDADEEAIGRALSGLHSRFPFILLDETGDMPAQVGRAAEQLFTGSPEDALIASAGNPTSTSGLLYEMCNRLRDLWEVITITADPNDPKRTPRVDAEHAQAMIDEYGMDNPWVMATILGQFPAVGFNSLLGIEDVEAAMSRRYREDQFSFAPLIIGVDVARQGDDCSVLFPRQGMIAYKPQIYRNLRSYDIAGHTAKLQDRLGADGVIIDGTGGWGGGVIDAFELMGRDSFDCQFAGKPYDERYKNKRAEIWFLMAEWVKKGGALPHIPRLIPELTTPTYTFHGDKFIIEPKEDIKKKLGRSPDLADALAITFAEPITKRDRLAELHDSMSPTKEWHPFVGM